MHLCRTSYVSIAVMLFIITCSVGCRAGDVCYSKSLAQVKAVVKEAEASRGGYSIGHFENPVSSSVIDRLKRIPLYRQALTEILLDISTRYSNPDGPDDYDEPGFVHICDIIAATGDEYFIDVLKRVPSVPLRQRMAVIRAIKILEGVIEEPKCRIGTSKEEVLRAEGEPQHIIKYSALDEEGKKLYRRRLSVPGVAELWIYRDYIYGLDEEGKVYRIIQEEGGDLMRKLINYVIKKQER